ncbi:MAG TPA: hypothetical protein VIL34_05470 [Actinopolymorphaceae bacterium]
MELSSELAEIAMALYATPPAEFVAARNEQVSRARAAGQPKLARALGKLRKPTQSAWLVNLLARERAEMLAEYLELGREFGLAYEKGSGELLRELSTRRQRLVSALLRAARELADDQGVRMSAETSRAVEGTLSAALVDPEVAEQVRLGLVVSPVDYAGFGPELIPPRATLVGRGQAEAPQGKEAAQPRGRARSSKAAAREAEAQRRLDEAQADVVAAERELAERDAALDQAMRRAEAAKAEVERLRSELRDAEERLHAEERGVRAETKRRQRAVDALALAKRRQADAVRRFARST